MNNTKKLFIKTYGCQMNVYDSERMSEALGADGYEKTDSPDEADMILLNTCHIREKAAEKIYSELGRYKELKASKPELKIGVAGCVAQAEGEEIIKRQPLVDLVVGPQSYQNIAGLAAKAVDGTKQIDINFPKEDKFTLLKGARSAQRGPSAFLTVQEGCDKFCAFCVVPYTRGAESSRPVLQVVDEAKHLVDSGVREITLLGQNVNAYHGAGSDGKEWSLAKLIWELDKVDGLARIRFTTSHPNDMTDDLIEAHGTCKKLMPYLHLPVQSGSNRILKRMNRSHDAESYISLISKIREARPDILISGDFIVGFPEETDKDFYETISLIKNIEYGQAFSFKYSTRPGTPAAERDQVCEEVKTARLYELQDLIKKQQKNIQDKMIGRNVQVLFDRKGRFNNQLVGKSEYLHAVNVTDPTIAVGELKNVYITKSNTNSLSGSILNYCSINNKC
ncbi:MAG: tRNA (N6-isopentenyl adenosine(37)-C2)-methylthiotransferase MiaB [Paracoccaceae bacterium]|nr:tRNA (N6-isopentenyl adenosine(37)-C2)-methylthiotransferase MiaB [Paracoccaceae bacterium]